MTSRTVRMERLLDASPSRVYRAWSDPDALTSWFPSEVEGSLAPGGRTTLVWPEQTVWWEVTETEPDKLFRFRWPWLSDDSIRTDVTVSLSPRGFGTRLVLKDGPFDIDHPDQLDAWAECVEGWAEALANLRATLDFSVDLRHVRGRMGAGPR